MWELALGKNTCLALSVSVAHSFPFPFLSHPFMLSDPCEDLHFFLSVREMCRTPPVRSTGMMGVIPVSSPIGS